MSLATYIHYVREKIRAIHFRIKVKRIPQKITDHTIKKEISFLIKDFIVRFWKKWATTLSVFIAISAGIAEGTGYNLRDLLVGDTSKTFSIAVMVHGEQGKGHLIMRNQGSVLLDVGDIRLESPINYQGVATFKEIPLRYKTKKAFLYVDHPSSYRLLIPEKQYQLNEGQAIYLKVGVEEEHTKYYNLVDF